MKVSNLSAVYIEFYTKNKTLIMREQPSLNIIIPLFPSPSLSSIPWTFLAHRVAFRRTVAATVTDHDGERRTSLLSQQRLTVVLVWPLFWGGEPSDCRPSSTHSSASFTSLSSYSYTTNSTLSSTHSSASSTPFHLLVFFFYSFILLLFFLF